MTMNTNEWEEIFDQKFCLLMYGNDISPYKNLGLLNETAANRLKQLHPTKPKPIPPTANDLKDFIRNLLTAHTTELKEKIKGLNKRHGISYDAFSPDADLAIYNKAISDVLALLSPTLPDDKEKI